MTFKVIYPDDIRDLAAAGATVIDIRDQAAYAKGHYRGAVNIPFEQLPQAISQIPKDKTLVIYCEYGGTGIMAARRLGALGYTVATVAGGMRAIEKMSAGSGL